MAAFEEVFHSHSRKMKSLAYNLLGNIPDAEDAVQEAFLKACRGAGRFSGQSALATWMYRILVNTCHDVGRSRKRRVEKIPDGPGFAQTADIALRVALERAVAMLNERQRSVFLLFEVEGFRHAEIAAILEVPEATSRTLLFEARRELQRLIEEGDRHAG
jgi:RNA polymerase sigma-70 factor (ECF subfamily)